MSEFINKINEWFVETLGTWTVEYFSLWLIIAAALLLVLIITFIAAGVSSSKKKKKIKELSAKSGNNAAQVDEATLRNQIRAEVLAEVGHGDNAERLAEAQNAATLLSAQVDQQKRTIETLEDNNREKQNRINELTSMLEQSKSGAGTANNDLYRQINELNETVRDQENEINKLKAENAQVKAQALQQQIASKSKSTTAEPKIVLKKSPASETTAAKTSNSKAAKHTTAVEDDDDEYDEYYDDYGDENSAIKVTLKFDRVKNNWMVLRSDTDRAYRRLATKQEALVIAKDLARRLHAQLVVHKKDGKFQKI